MRYTIISFALFICLPSNCIAQSIFLTRDNAHDRAVQILKGDPYGHTPVELSRTIKSELLGVDGKDELACDVDYRKNPAWRFRVVVEKNDMTDGIDGYLLLDARTGKLRAQGSHSWIEVAARLGPASDWSS
jgi:hypothetical protein